MGTFAADDRAADYTSDPVLFCAGVYTLNPQRSHVSLFLPTISICILQGFLDSLLGYPQAVFAPSTKPLRQPEYFVFLHPLTPALCLSRCTVLPQSDVTSFSQVH